MILIEGLCKHYGGTRAVAVSTAYLVFRLFGYRSTMRLLVLLAVLAAVIGVLHWMVPRRLNAISHRFVFDN